MTTNILDGKALAKSIQTKLKHEISDLIKNKQPAPGLDVILVGENPASEAYVKHKQKACEHVGIRSRRHKLPTTVTQTEIANLIEQCNQDNSVHGILLQLPLPVGIDADELLSLIDPKKDIDGFHPINLGLLAQRRPYLRPCTPYGIIQLLKHNKIELTGKHMVIIGASNLVGRPMALEGLLANCTVTVCHKHTTDLEKHVKAADILVVAIGKPGIVNSEWIPKGCVVIDVGCSKLADGSLVGDIDFDSAKDRASFITPVPGGVGPMTIATLLENTLQACKTISDAS